ncbi:DUF3348 domain-containing protein [Dyella sp. C11]|uniref:DUF3348 domain-containing protein n=1 Tax=Dyella sp. C11 TaxID=2126991 RepID=UPI000D64D3AC|nr:DUF3348 domain-containing protein [Dyella sp. C11]
MVQVSSRTAVRGPTFIRLLARLTGVDVAPSSQSLPDRLGQWLDWRQSLALSTALDSRPSAQDNGAPAFGAAEEEECARIRAALVDAITADAESAVATDVEYAVFRQRYQTMQRRMQSATGHWRGRLRDMLAQRSDDSALLADVDAAMERVLSPREHTLLASVPTLLENHFERLRQTGDDTWLETFRRDMQSVLLAELDVRFQPVEGLLAALRTR